MIQHKIGAKLEPPSLVQRFLITRFIRDNKIDQLVDKVIPSAIIYTILFYLPTAFYVAHERLAVSLVLSGLMAISELVAVFLLTVIIFCVAAKLGSAILYLIVILFYSIGGVNIYFLLNFGKNLGIWSIQSMLYYESNFVEDMMGMQLVLIVAVSVIIGLISISSGKIKFKRSINLITASFCYTIVSMTWLGSLLFHSIVNNYNPYPEIKGLHLYLFHKNDHHDSEVKNDISEMYDFIYKPKTSNPITVVMVIGESLRGDVLELNGYKHFANTPLLQKIPNLVSFKYATSSGSETQSTIPNMLTRSYNSGNSKSVSAETTFISVFRRLGFKTAWIGAQSSFSANDIYVSSIPLEAEYIVTRKEIMGYNGRHNIYDGDMLPIIKKYIEQNKNYNKLIIVHMIGSHWRLDHRYPSGFGAFYPICRNASPTSCSKSELENSYHNTVLYTDTFLYSLITMLEKDLAFLLFSSDHGSQITENHFEDSEDRIENGTDPDMISIAMMIWSSAKFLQEHENSYREQMAKRDSENVSHNNIFHSILGCIGIESTAINGDLNLCR